MKKLFGRGQKTVAVGPLCNRTVQVGAWTVMCEALLGSGGYADIYRVRDISSGGLYALKHLRLNGDQEIIAEVQREAKTQAKLKTHPNILRLHAVSFAGPKGGETDGFFLLDYCPGTLLDLLQRHNFQLEERTVLHIFNCVCQAVAHMHRQKPPMAHRDLKAENVLMLPDGTWVLCDYGSTTTRAQVYDTADAIAAEEEVIRKHTTPAYRPPEMWDLYQRQLIDTKVDIWALGVLLFVLCFGRLPFTGDSKLQVLNGKYEMPPTRHPQLRALIKRLLAINPAERPDISQTLEQLNQAALAILGKPLTPPSGSIAPGLPASSTTAVSGVAPPPAAQQAAQQQLQQLPQPLLQQQPAAAAVSGGAFWGTVDALVNKQQQHAAAATAGDGAHALPQQQQQQQLTPDWVRFSSAGAAAQQPAAVQHVQQAQAGTPGSPAHRAQAVAVPVPQAAAAAGSGSGSAAGTPPLWEGSGAAAAASAPTTSNGYYPSIILAHSSGSSSSLAGQQQGSPGLGRLADITARAQAAAAAKTSQAAAAVAPQQQQNDEPPLVLERQPRPHYSSGSSASSTEATPGLAAAAATATAGAVRPRLTPAAQGSAAGGPSISANVMQAATSNRSVQETSGSAGSNTSSRAAAAAGPSSSQYGAQSVGAAMAGMAAGGGAATSTAFSGSNTHPLPSNTAMVGPLTAAATNPGAPAGAAAAQPHAVDASVLADLRAAVFGEMNLLRAQVRSLSDQNQAFVFRIKQLEGYAQRQETAVAKLQEQVAALQQQQVDGSSLVRDGLVGSSRPAAMQRRSSDTGPAGHTATVGGSYWSTESAAN